MTTPNPPVPDSGDTLVIHEDLTQEILDGLRREPKHLPCKLFYDERGSQLFDQICELPEYYPTRTELGILDSFGSEMGEFIGPRACVIEPGAGSVVKIRKLIDHLDAPRWFVPLDISSDHLVTSVKALNALYPDLSILPIEADYMTDETIEEQLPDEGRRVVFFPGSTIGNFTPEEASSFLRRMAHWVGEGGELIIGTDLVKESSLLHAAYNDAQGVTAAFNLNILNVINRNCHAHFDPSRFQHEAVYNAQHRRVEIGLISLGDQEVEIDGEWIELADGEKIITEYSHKHTIDSFREQAEDAGFVQEHVWTDDRQWFAVRGLRAGTL